MTRETKIGLVVGLAFIIVIGVLVSDHLSSVNRPPRPQFADGNAAAERSTLTPGAGVRRGTDREIRLDNPIEPGGRLQADRTQPSPRPRDNGAANGNLTPLDPNGGRTTTPGNPNDIRPIPGNRDNADTPRPDQPRDNDPDITLPPGTALYEAKAGDTVSKLAAKFLGANTNANRDKIINLNAGLRANPNRIVVGEVYIVPDPNARGVARGESGPGRSGLIPLVNPERTDLRGGPAAPREELATTSYTTRPGDTLWKIARDQCGSQSKATVDQIKTLNQDVLKGKELLQPNMKLKIPTRAVATR